MLLSFLVFRFEFRDEFFVDFEGPVIFLCLMEIVFLDGVGFEDDFVELLFEVILFFIVDDFVMDDDVTHLEHGHFLKVFVEKVEFDGFELIFEVGDLVFARRFVGLELLGQDNVFGFFFVEALEFVFEVQFLVVGVIVAFLDVGHVVFGSGKLWIV